jgi:hypothetical protein
VIDIGLGLVGRPRDDVVKVLLREDRRELRDGREAQAPVAERRLELR